MRLTSVAVIHVRGRPSRERGGSRRGSAAANDYPTSARADYVFACMKTNGDTREALDQCSCSIDVIASLLPYDAYVAAATVASMDQAARTDRRHVPRRRDRARRPGPVAARSGGRRSALLLTAPVR